MKLDVKVAMSSFLLGLVFLVVAILLNYGIGFATTIVISCFTYLVLTRKRKNGTQPLLSVSLKTKQPFYVLFLITTAATIAFFLWSSFCFLYTRPFEYFIAAAVLSATIVFEIGLLRPDGNKLGLYNVLAQILLLTATLRWSSLFAYPGFVGADPWGHSFRVENILEQGYVYSELGQYTFFPFMHILISEVQQVASFPSLKYAFTFSVGLFEVISIFFVFILARRIFYDEKRAAVASLLVGVSSWHIRWGFWIIPMTMGLAFFTLLLSLLPHFWFSNKVRGGRKIFALFLLIFTVLVFTHTIASLIGLLFLFFVWIGEKALKSYTGVYRNRSPSALLLLATVILGAYWTFAYVIDDLIPFFISTTTYAPLKPTVRSLAHFEIDNLGTYCLYFLAILGGLGWLKRLNRGKASILSGAAGLSLFVYGNVLIGVYSFLPERWIAFLFVLLAPIAADGYHLLSRHLTKGRKAVLPLLIFLLTFSMVISGNSNVDSPIYYPEEFGVRKALTESEITATRVAASVSKSILYADDGDMILIPTLWWTLQRKIIGIDFENFDLNTIDGLIVIRRDAYFRPTTMPSALDETNNIYSNGQVEMFLRQGG